MIDLKGFRKANNLTQDELGGYLGIKKSFISKIEHGGASLPNDKFAKLMVNTEGWDTSLLTEEIILDETSSAINNLLNKKPNDGDFASLLLEIKLLRAQLEEVKAEKDKYWEMICKLTEK